MLMIKDARARLKLDSSFLIGVGDRPLEISGTSQRNEPFHCGVLVHGSRRNPP
jgi:hypothetical protein